MPPWTILYEVEQSLKCSISLHSKGQRKHTHKPHPEHSSRSIASRAPPRVEASGPALQPHHLNQAGHLPIQMHEGSKWSRAMGLNSPCSLYPEKTIIWKDTCTPTFTAALLTIASTWEQPKRPLMEERVKKTRHMYTMDYYSAIKRME